MSIFDRVKQKKPASSVPNKAQERLARLSATRRSRDPVDQEIQRIVGLPLVEPITPEEAEEFCRENILAEAFNKGWRLFDSQVGAVLSYDLYDGGFFPIGVGWGKTLISLMIAERAYRAGKRSLLMVPSQVYPQLVKNDIQWARRHVPLSTPFTQLGNKSRAARMKGARSGRPGCYILPYSCLSTTDSEQLLEIIAADVLILDEAHLVKNFKAARTSRLFGRHGYVTNHRPQVVAMSGTVTSKSITDYWHLIKSALGPHCPLPLSSHLIRQWAQVLDAQPVETSEGSTEPIMPLVRWAARHFPEEKFGEHTRGLRKAYKHRLTTAPGVVATGDNEIGTSLVLSDRPVERPHTRDGWDTLCELEQQVREEWLAPNGDEIDHAMHSYKWLYELSAGFYNDLYWPAAEKLAEERNLSPRLAAELLERAQDHHQLLQLYHSALRKWLTTRAKPGLDTPFLVAGDMEHNGHKNVGRNLYEMWRAVKDAEFDGMPKRRSRPIRICDYKVHAAVQWARKTCPLPTDGAIIWYWNQEIGRWLIEALTAANLNPLHCPAGKEAHKTIIDPANKGRIVVASIDAHNIGKNLQHFSEQYVVQWPRSPVIAEQMLGRTHRNGQEADELIVHMNSTTQIDADNFAACLNDTAYIHQTTGDRKKLMFATYDPTPTIVDPRVLRKRGLNNKLLTGEQLELLRDKFGAAA